MEEIEFFLQEAEESMSNALARTLQAFTKIRAGKALPSMLDGLRVDNYGVPAPISQVASINSMDARTLGIKPWDRKMIVAIERAIMNSDLGVNPQNDGETIRITVPMLTEERRKDLVKQAKGESDNGKVIVRSVRKETNEALRKLMKEGASEDAVKEAETKTQALTDKFVRKMDEILAQKEVEIMKV